MTGYIMILPFKIIMYVAPKCIEMLSHTALGLGDNEPQAVTVHSLAQRKTVYNVSDITKFKTETRLLRDADTAILPPPHGLCQHGNGNTCFLAATLIYFASWGSLFLLQKFKSCILACFPCPAYSY